MLAVSTMIADVVNISRMFPSGSLACGLAGHDAWRRLSNCFMESVNGTRAVPYATDRHFLPYAGLGKIGFACPYASTKLGRTEET